MVTRTVTGDKMTVAMECRGVAATAVFRRKQELKLHYKMRHLAP